jgi:hypothetical protein
MEAAQNFAGGAAFALKHFDGYFPSTGAIPYSNLANTFLGEKGLKGR